MSQIANLKLAVASLIALATTASPAAAYIGPGAGLGAVAVTVALILGALLLMAGLIWFPVKRMLKGRSDKGAENRTDESE